LRPALADLAIVLEQPLHPGCDPALRDYAKAQRLQEVEQRGMSGRRRVAIGRADAVGEEGERPRGAEAGIELAQRPGGRVAGVDERALAAGALALVELEERAL